MQIHRIEIAYTIDFYNGSNLVHADSSCSPSQSPAVPRSEPPTSGSSPAPVPASPLEHTHKHPLVIVIPTSKHIQANNVADIDI